MKKKNLFISLVALSFVGLSIFLFNLLSTPETFHVTLDENAAATEKVREDLIEDISQKTHSYTLTQPNGGQADLTLTVREFPNSDKMLYIEAQSKGYQKPIEINLPLSDKADLLYSEDSTVPEMYAYRKPRTVPDPLSTTLRYIESKDNSALLGTAVYFSDLSHTYENGEKSNVVEFQREAPGVSRDKGNWELIVQFEPGETHFSTWLMIAEEPLIENEVHFQKVHAIGADEFRWITPDRLLSHGVNSIFPKSDNAFVSSLVRQSGRSSAVMLDTEPSRFWENINRHHFASLESSRADDGLWHSDYTSTWLEKAYGFGPEYIDTRHNDNIFRSQLTRAKLLGYESYAKERAVYADFLIEMADAGFIIPEGNGYYLIDYFDMTSKTHASLNHALSLMNYQYDAFKHLGDEKYLVSAESQFSALLETGTDWINEDRTIIYQMRPDGTMTGSDYNLVTYYDLLYTKKLRQELKLPSSDTLERLIQVKKGNIIKNGLPIEGTIDTVENFVGLIE